MLWSREWARVPRARGDLERGGDSPEGAFSRRARWRFARGGVQPSSEVEIRPKGRPALKQGGDLVVRRLALERGGSSLEGRRGWPLDGPLRLFGPWAVLCTRP
jgi:hypothetical protein